MVAQRSFMLQAMNHVTSVPLPPECGIVKTYASVNLADAFSVELPADASGDPEVLARFLFSQKPRWVDGLMAVRDVLVAGFGLKTTRDLNALEAKERSQRVGIFRIYSTSATEIILGEDDSHLDFRLSVLCANDATQPAGRRLVVSTVVHCHNLLGRTYIRVIAPIHRQVVQAYLRRAARAGWPTAAAQA
jgi:hypothetical protein